MLPLLIMERLPPPEDGPGDPRMEEHTAATSQESGVNTGSLTDEPLHNINTARRRVESGRENITQGVTRWH